MVLKVGNEKLDSKEMKETVEKAVKEVVRERVAEMMDESEEE